MSYPNSIDSYKTLVNYQETFSEPLFLSVSPIPFVISVSHDILSDVSFSSIYSTEVNSTPTSGQFRVLYGTNQIELGPLSASANIFVTYKCAGDIIYANHINNVQTPIVNIESTLGINPQGSYPDVASRLNALEGITGLVAASKDFTGTLDGQTKTFILDYPPKSPEFVWVYLNGLLQRPNVHYTISGMYIVFNEAPLSTDELYICYFKEA